MKHDIDLNTWKRREHFEFFKNFSSPFWTVTVQLDCTKLYQKAKANNRSFYLSCLHAVLRAANQTPALRIRIEDGKPVQYDRIHIFPTFPREDGTFGCAFFEFKEDLDEFSAAARAKENALKQKPGFCPDPEGERPDAIYFSALPWIHFTALVSEHNGSNRGIPNMTVGKMAEHDGKRTLPLSVAAHHAVADGKDVGEFLERLQQFFDE